MKHCVLIDTVLRSRHVLVCVGVPADLLIDLPDVYNDLRIGLAGDELRKVREKTTVNATEYVTEFWFNHKVSAC